MQNCDHRSGNTATVFAAASQSAILSICHGPREPPANGDTHFTNTVQCTGQHIASHLHDVDRFIDTERRRWIQQEYTPNSKSTKSSRFPYFFFLLFSVSIILFVCRH